MKGQEENEGSAVTSWKTRIKKRYKRWKRRQIKKKNDPEYQKKKRAAARFRKKLVRYLSHAWMFPIVVKNSMSCHRFTLTLCHNLIHFLVTDSGAIAPNF